MKILVLAGMTILSLQMKSDKPEVVIENERQNILIMGVGNPVRALIEKSPKEVVVLTAPNARIEKAEGSRFIIIPHEIGLLKVSVCKVIKKDTVVAGTIEFRVHQLPEPTARIGGLNSGPLKKEVLLAAGGIIARLENTEFDFPIQIKEYTLLAMRDSTVIGTSKNTGARYSERSLALIKDLRANDKLIVYGILTRLPEQMRLVHPLEFIIEE